MIVTTMEPEGALPEWVELLPAGLLGMLAATPLLRRRQNGSQGNNHA